MGVHIRKIEQKLFQYLFLNKVATSFQISRDIWKDSISHQALYKRLNMLIKEKYIEANYHKELGGRLVYSLHAKVLKSMNLVQSKLVRVQLRSDSILHDLTLNDIQCCLKAVQGIEEYFTENALRSGIELPNEDLLMALRKFNFDAVLNVNRQGQQHYIPLEFERSLKFDSRYRQYFKRLYSEDQIKAILFVGGDKKILKHVQMLEQESTSGAWPKAFYVLLEDILAKPESITFTNLNQERLIFNRLQPLHGLQPTTQNINAL